MVTVEGVSKKFCRSLKKSLWYGLQDMISEIVPLGARARSADRPGATQAEASELRQGEFWAVNGISFELRRGECLGLIGRNGAGKTTLLRMLNGLIKPDVGRIEMRGRVGALIALGAGFNPILSGRENVYVNGSILGLTRTEIDAKIEEIIDFADIRDFIDAPVQSYSSGMQVRLGFAVATAMQPDVLILDEVLAVGDAAFRNKCYRRIADLRKKAAVIFVTHNMEQVARVCDKSLVMAKGRIVCLGDVNEGIAAYERINEDNKGAPESFLSTHPPLNDFAIDDFPKEVLSGDACKLALSVWSLEEVPRFTLRIMFYNASGGFAADCNIASETAAIQIKPGRNSWTLEFGGIPLKNGKYLLAVNVIDPTGDLLVWSYKQREVVVHGAYAGAIADCQIPIRDWAVELGGVR
jgi:lipopolysaccharide transport system ATP-binding protein